jgi:hypothetical protein
MDSVEALARNIVRQMWEYTEGLPGRWAPLATISERLKLANDLATNAAALFAVEQGWLEEFGDYNSIRLANAGRSLGVAVEEELDLPAKGAKVPITESKAA